MNSFLIDSLLYKILYWTSIGLSILGFIIFLACTLITGSLTRKLTRMIFFMSLSNLLYSLAFALVGSIDSRFCMILAWIEEFTIISSLTWSCYLAYSLKLIVCGEDLSILDRLMAWYYLFSVLIPLTFVGGSIFHDISEFNWDPITSEDPLICYQNLPHHRDDYKYPITVALPLILALIFCFYSNVKTLREVNNLHQKSGLHVNKWLVLVYPAIILICWGPITIGNVLFTLGVVEDRTSNYWFELLTRMQGVLTTLVYVCSKGVTQELRRAMSREESNLTSNESRKPFLSREISESKVSVDSADRFKLNFSEWSKNQSFYDSVSFVSR